MALLKIARMGHPVLRTVAEPIADPLAPEIQRLGVDMVETMHDAHGAGLAGPQVYESRRIIVFHAPVERGGPQTEATAPLTIVINPEITFIEPPEDGPADWEGCLSIPDLRGQVPRSPHIGYKGLGLKGETIEREAKGFHARVVQHEVDHLDGVLYIDRMKGFNSLTFESEIHHLLAKREGS